MQRVRATEPITVDLARQRAPTTLPWRAPFVAPKLAIVTLKKRAMVNQKLVPKMKYKVLALNVVAVSKNISILHFMKVI